LAETSHSFGRGMRSLEIFLALAAAVLPNMFLFWKALWRSSLPIFHLSRLRLYPWQHSPPCKACAIKGIYSPGQKVLIHGASGGVGTIAVQIAKAFEAEVTAVCSTRNLELARSIGADHVIDYTKEDFTQNGQQYDLILAVNGYHPLSAYKRALTPQGIYVFTGGLPAQIFQSLLLGPFMSKSDGKKMTSFVKKANQKDLLFIRDLLEEGKIRPVIDECYPLSKTAEAFRYFEKGHARGKVVVTIAA
jgi:NADPH:quinone reductase-like Zn-dependent oxidoreductase